MCVAGSLDGRYMATVSRDQFRHVTSLLLFHGGTLEPYMRIETDVQAFTRSVGKAWEDDLDLGLGFRVRIFGAKPLRRAKWAAMTASEWPCPALICHSTSHPSFCPLWCAPQTLSPSPLLAVSRSATEGVSYGR